MILRIFNSQKVYKVITTISQPTSQFQSNLISNRGQARMLIEEQNQQKDNSDGSMGSPTGNKFVSNINWKTSMKALMYKNIKIQQRSMCSNVCQIITPLLCVAFTLIVKIITSEIVTSKVQMPSFPRPFNLPILYDLLPFNISCKEIYLFQYNGLPSNRKYVQELFEKNLKRYCEETQSLVPSFEQKKSMNEYMINILKQAQKQPYNHGVDMKAPIPDGVFIINQIDSKRLNATISINDYRLSQYHRNNGVTKFSLNLNSSIVSYVMTTQGFMSTLEKVTRPFLQLSNPKQVIFGSYMYMPFDGEDTALIDKTINVIGSGLYPLGLSLLLPLFLYTIVSEKQEKLVQVMRMNGLKIKYYWISTFLFNFVLSMATFGIFYIFGAHILGLTFFTQTSSVFMWVVLVGWAIAQIGMTNLVQIFVRNGKSATIIGYILSIFSTLLGETISVAVYADPQTMPFSLLIYPPFALCRIIYKMGIACSSTGCYKSLFDISRQSTQCILILYGWFLIFIFSIWLNDQIQQQYGVASESRIKNIVVRFFRFFCKLKKKEGQQDSQFQIEMKSQNDEKNTIDSSVKKMKETVNQIKNYKANLLVRQLSKKYGTSNGNEDYVALKPFSLMIEEKQIFGLLGPNGAGKTTLISVLTGMYPKSSGDAWINGVQVSQGQANEYIGVCPQFDLLWSNLTVYEHVKFYAILKGLGSQMLEAKIQQSLNDVDLRQWSETKSCQLSGGMQRRLSIAIALVGSPSVVFLDQPSSGLDPSHRRKLWNILKKCKNKASIILTTHLMQQAEELCDRIGIISKGQLKCIGKTQSLKQSFGEGYRLHINFTNILNEQNSRVIEQLCSRYNTKIVSELDTRVILKVEKDNIFQCIKSIKKYPNVNWMVSQPSLYDVFMNFVE